MADNTNSAGDNKNERPSNAVWSPKNRLNLIDDASFALASEFLKKGYVKGISITEADGKPTVRAYFSVETCEAAALNDEYTPTNEDRVVRTTIDGAIGVCDTPTCCRNRCIPLIAAYMKYLETNGWLGDVLSEREKFRSKPDFKNDVFEFDWLPDGDSLNVIPQNYIDAAEELLFYDLCTVRPTPSKSGFIPIDFDNRICRSLQLEDANFTFTDFMLHLERTKGLTSNMGDGITIGTKFNPAVSNCSGTCENCKCEFCVPVIAAYIKYLRESGYENMVKRAELERQEFPENIRYGTKMPFEESDQTVKKLVDQILCLPKDVLDGVSRLLDSGQVSVFPHTPKDKKHKSKDDEDIICDLAIWYYKEGKVLTEAKTIGDFFCSDETEGVFIYHIKSLEFTSKELPFYEIVLRATVALDYLRKSSFNTETLSFRRAKVIDRFMRETEQVPGLERIMRLANNEKTNSLFCIIEGSKDTGKRKIVETIAEVLAQNGKIKTKDYQKCTFEELGRTLIRSYEPAYREEHDPYSYPSGPYYEGPKYNVFEKQVLYVVTGLQKFLRDVEEEGAHETRMEHILKILGRAEKDTYVVILGLSPDEVDSFLALDSRYKFLYGQNRLHIPNMTTEQLCREYLSELSQDVRSQIKDEEEFRQKFAEYIAFNEKFLPMGNTELVNYLANYSNVEGKPELPPNAYNNKNAALALEEMIGMSAIKQQVKDFEQFMAFQKKAQASGIKVEHGNMHMLFTGNPGTGKTTVARIIASMLFDIGVLKSNKLIEVERKDLVASYVGQTANKTGEVIKKALGGVLFIDEAYALMLDDSDSFGKEAIATIVKAMEDHKEDLIVIFAGYEKEMNDFLKSNSGIESRVGYTFRFENYSLSELSQMYVNNLTKSNFTLSPGVRKAMENVTEFFVNRRYFGNGRFVKKMTQETIIRHAKNEQTQDDWQLNLITEEDVPTVEDMSVKTSAEETKTSGLENLIGLDDIKDQIKKFRNTVAFRRKAGNLGIKIPRGNNHMLFCGNPGTGKTTIARIMARELYDAGIVAENKLIEVGRQDLVGQYLGQTAPKTQDVITRALGGVLFIDEAYSLTSGGNGGDSYGEEAVTTLVKAMEDYKDNLVIIFSGYTDKMDEFVASNPGIASRIGFTFNFKDYTADELTQIFRLKVTKTGLKADDPAVLEKTKSIMQYFVSVPNFGNGRFAERVVQMTFEIHAERCMNLTDPDELANITVDDIPSVKYLIEHMSNGDEMLNPEDIEETQHLRTAVHELGHAIVCKKLFPKTPIERITISAEGNGALGYVQHKGYGIGNKTATELKKQISVNMAGIAAEEVVLGEYGNGGTSDLESATNIAWAMISRYGMSKKGFTVKKDRTAQGNEEVDEILAECFEDAKHIISDNLTALKTAKDILLKNKSITDEELTNILEG
ncbi:MAG: AAA family ATPase [Clostridia bacterium]|nr:AAA family ATPase [Clostridia bacterium]